MNTPIPDPRLTRSDLPDELVAILRKMVAKSPANRYQTCDALIADLEAFEKGRLVQPIWRFVAPGCKGLNLFAQFTFIEQDIPYSWPTQRRWIDGLHHALGGRRGAPEEFSRRRGNTMVTEDPSLVGTKPLSLDDLRETWPILVPDERADGFRLLTRERGEEYFAGLSARDTADLLERFTPSERRSWLRVLPPDDIADVAQEMDPDRVRELLALLDPATRSEVNALLVYAEDAAGGLMSPRFAHVRPDMRSDEAIAYLRRQAEHLETMYYIYVIDKERKLLGVCSFRELFVAPRDKLVRDVMRTEFVAVQEEDDQEDVARIFAEQDLMVVPVLDSDRRMKGIVTHDDIVDVVEEEATEDMHKMGGMEALEMPYLDIGFFRMIKKRGLWLGVLFVGQMLTIPVLEHYKHQFAVASYLMFFVPLIIASGGMTGSQAATLVIRAMALSEVKLRDWWRVMRREVRSGLALGCLLAGIGLTAVGLLQFTRHLFGENFLQVALIVPLSLLGVVVFGTVFGSLLPFIMGRMGFDSASASTPFVATIVDISGLIIYLSTAQLILYLTLN